MRLTERATKFRFAMLKKYGHEPEEWLVTPEEMLELMSMSTTGEAAYSPVGYTIAGGPRLFGMPVRENLFYGLDAMLKGHGF